MTKPTGLPCRVVFALCGSFCTFGAVMPQIRELVRRGWQVQPVLSWTAAALDTRFGTAASWREQLCRITGREPLTTLQQVEPLGPEGLADGMVIAPCTGTTLAKLAHGLSDTPVTMAAKSLLRRGLPVVVAPSTNDGLGASAPNLAQLLLRRNYYFVPFGQDDSIRKPASLKSDMSLIPDTLACAMQGIQLQPLLL